ncbi:hypothetical protein LVD17_01310 [Fulvivirga ulvae]|uniref:HD domain-containing protein n=1 Tax=Fulvivirga ulvae TaxID=2904245 RepID=UPI001F30559E|nr:hypothetical protein [Fulvivirga ulvae]UII32477.1 hypothetical protein LVD17_01310 [Fulvivirga ulvae]
MKKLFQGQVRRYTDDAALPDSFWVEIETKYSGKRRYYHNLHHLENLLEQLSEVKLSIKDWDVTLFALFYHDLVYNPARRDNEEKSARMAGERLKSINFPKDGVDKCRNMILATKGHADASDNDTNLFTDADLSILGCAHDQYMEYARQVREEYHIYPDMLYKPGRKKVLQYFLSMDRIFKTNHFYDKFEAQARENLSIELKSL